MKTSVSIQFDDADKILTRIIPKSKKLRIAEMLEENMAPYVPRDTGNLMNNTTITADFIQYNENYAEVNYRGHGRNFSKEKNPLATAEWDKAMMNAKGDAISREIERIIKS